MLGCLQDSLCYEVIGIWLLLTGVVGFLAMGIDKARAIGGEWRIPEMTLFIMALAGGAPGMFLGSEVFHHKTAKLSFLLVLYPIAGTWLFLLHQIGFLECLSTYLPR